MKQRIENKLKELEKRYERRLRLSKSLEDDFELSCFWYEKANETLKQIELLKEIKGE